MDNLKVEAGLDGVVADKTSVSGYTQEGLVYRDAPLSHLLNNSTADEVAFLLLFHSMPSRDGLLKFKRLESSFRVLSNDTFELIKKFAGKAHPVDLYRSVISQEGMRQELKEWTFIDQATWLYAQTPMIFAAIYRLERDLPLLLPDQDLDSTSNLFYSFFGRLLPSEDIQVLDRIRMIYSEHGFNAASFTSRVVASTQADFFSAVTAAIACLSGPIHGGAIEKVAEMVDELQGVRVPHWLNLKRQNKQKIMGFGHRIYKNSIDPRAQLIRKQALELAARYQSAQLFDPLLELETLMAEKLRLYPNVDYFMAPTFKCLGFPATFHLPLIMTARCLGWSAHFEEQRRAGRLIRPSSLYVSSSKFVPRKSGDTMELTTQG